MDPLSDYIIGNLKAYSRTSLCKIQRDYFFQTYYYEDIFLHSQQLCSYFQQQGLVPGDRITIWAPNSPEWIIVFFACILSGVTIVPISQLASSDLAESIVENVSPKIHFTSIINSNIKSVTTIFIESLVDICKTLSPTQIKFEGTGEEILEILFTSGTTGTPKGALISRKAVMNAINSIKYALPDIRERNMLSMLPYSHVYEQIVVLLTAISIGSNLFFVWPLSPHLITQALHNFKIDNINVVPELLNSFTTQLKNKLEKYKLLRVLLTSMQVSQYCPAWFRRVVYAPILNAFAPKLRTIRIGGAKSNKKDLEFWFNLGINVQEGYGLTETAGVVTLTKFSRSELGTIGNAISPDVEIKLSTDGELCIRSNQLFSGYWQNIDKGNNLYVDNDGFLHTGDQAQKVGYSYAILGRNKFRIIIPSGEKVYPEDIEDKIRNTNLIKAVCVFPFFEKDGSTTVAAAFILNSSTACLSEVVANANRQLENYQQIQHYFTWTGSSFPYINHIKVDRKEVADVGQKILEQGEKKVHRNSSEAFVSKTLRKLTDLLAVICDKSKEDIRPASILVRDLGLDSLRRLSLLMLIEEELQVTLQEQQITQHLSLEELAKLVDSAPNTKNQSPGVGWQFSSLVWVLRRVFCYEIFLIPFSHIFINLIPIGKENLTTPAIYVCNHPGHGDLLLLMKYLLRKNIPYFSATDGSIWRNKLFGRVLEFFIAGIPMDMSGLEIKNTFSRIGKLLDKGHSAIIVPVGHFTYCDEDLKDIKNGAAYLARRTKLPLIPVFVDQNYSDVQSEKTPNPYLPRRPKKRDTYLAIGKAFYIPENMSDQEANRLIAEKIIEQGKAIPT